jgi:hypothetical protein
MVSLFTVSSQLLSSQQHYDWGLRAMKACLTTGGSLKYAGRWLEHASNGTPRGMIASLSN